MKGKLKWILIGAVALMAGMAFIPKVRETIGGLMDKMKGQ